MHFFPLDIEITKNSWIIPDVQIVNKSVFLVFVKRNKEKRKEIHDFRSTQLITVE